VASSLWAAPMGLLQLIVRFPSPSSRMPSLESSQEETKPATPVAVVAGRPREGTTYYDQTCI